MWPNAHNGKKKINPNILDFQRKTIKYLNFILCLYQLGKRNKENGKTLSSLNVVRPAHEYPGFPKKSETHLESIQRVFLYQNYSLQSLFAIKKYHCKIIGNQTTL